MNSEEQNITLIFSRAKCLILRKNPSSWLEFSKMLSKNSSLLKCRDKNGRTLIHYAAKYSNCPDWSKILVIGDKSVFFLEDRFGYRPILYQCERAMLDDEICIYTLMEAMAVDKQCNKMNLFEFWLFNVYRSLYSNDNSEDAFVAALSELSNFCQSLDEFSSEYYYIRNLLSKKGIKNVSDVEKYSDHAGRTFLMRYLIYNQRWPIKIVKNFKDEKYQWTAKDFQGYSVHFFTFSSCSLFADAYAKGVFDDQNVRSPDGFTLLDYAVMYRHLGCDHRTVIKMMQDGHTMVDFDRCDGRLRAIDLNVANEIDFFIFALIFNIISLKKHLSYFFEFCDISDLSVDVQHFLKFVSFQVMACESAVSEIPSLMSLSRYAIRSRMFHSSKILKSIDSLSLPVPLINYLKLQDLCEFVKANHLSKSFTNSFVLP